MIQVFGLYRDYKFGRIFRVTSVAKSWESEEEYVIFHFAQGVESGDSGSPKPQDFILPTKKFIEEVEHLGSKSQRFSYLEPVKKMIHGKIECISQD
jgi:hypothetical protein